MMKKFILICCALMLCVSTSQARPLQKKNIKYAEQEVYEKKKKKEKAPFQCGYVREIRVGGFVTNPPFGWVDIIPSDLGESQDIYRNSGMAYQLFEKMSKEMGLKVKNVGFTSYHEALNALKKGQLDVLTGTYYDDRILGVGTKLLYPSYFANPIVVFFKKENDRPVKSFEDLTGLKGVVRQEEMIYSLLWRNLPKNLNLKQVSGARKAFSMLMTGEVDFMLSSAYAGESEIRRFKLMDDVVMGEYALASPELFFVFSTNSECAKLMPRYEEQLKKEKGENENNLLKPVIENIDVWGKRFADEPSLKEELNLSPTQ